MTSTWVGSTRQVSIHCRNSTYNLATFHNYLGWTSLKTSATAYMQWNGCVEARMRGTAGAGTDYNVNDAAPTIFTPATLFPAYFNPDTVGTSYGVNYIGTTGTPNEYTGLTSAQQSSTTTAGLLYKQENQAKYINRVIPAETCVPTLARGPTVRKLQLSH